MSEEDIQLGVVGVSEGNGHPYSFASIVNGYSADAFGDSGWDPILEYLETKDSAEFGFRGVEVSHAWTQDHAETEQLCAAALIPHAVDELTELLDSSIDGVLILRDDYDSHLDLARPFLDTGISVFIDKPLTMDPEELATFEPYLRSGQLMSCSGLRYARELDDTRTNFDTYGEVKLVRGTVLYDWPRYGIHVLEAILSTIDARPIAVTATSADHTSITIETDQGYPIQIDALGDAPPVFDVDIYGSERATRHELSDNFRAFRRTLAHFIDGIRTETAPIPPKETLLTIRTLIAGRHARQSGERVEVSSIGV